MKRAKLNVKKKRRQHQTAHRQLDPRRPARILNCHADELQRRAAHRHFRTETKTSRPPKIPSASACSSIRASPQYFAAHMTGVNQPLAVGDPVVQQVYTTNGMLPGPFAGQSINCRSCHFVTEFQGVTGAGNRTYSDFTAHSPIPLPMNGYTETPRNSMHMVGSLQPHPGPTFLHFDGEFATPEDLVKATLTGRNFGWAPDQFQQAEAQIALVIRGDDGSDQLAKDRTNGLSYGTLFLGTDSKITSDLLIPAADRIDVNTATDDQIVNLVAKCISTYMGDLLFAQDEFGRYIGSPYDVFLRINHLPVQPNAGESIPQYNQRL